MEPYYKSCLILTYLNKYKNVLNSFVRYNIEQVHFLFSLQFLNNLIFLKTTL